MSYSSEEFGKPLFIGEVRPTKQATIPVMGPRVAMGETLAQYLRCAVFRVAGKDAASRDFALEAVFPTWPDASTTLPYPCASVIESSDTFYEEYFVPQPIEESLGVWDCLVGYAPDPSYPKTVLWRTSEATCDFQIDFWTAALADRQAIEAELNYLFNPGQERTGVLLGGHPSYYAQPVRATLLSHRQIDEDNQVYPNERRLQAMVRCNVSVVDLRIAVLLTPQTSVEVTY